MGKDDKKGCGDGDEDDDGDDDDVDDVNQKTKQEQVEVQLCPFWGIRQYQIWRGWQEPIK